VSALSRLYRLYPYLFVVPLHQLYGHEELKERLVTALRAGTLPPAMLLVGAAGVGKQRLGLWLAAGLLCEKGPGAPCGECQSCRMVGTLGHPDVHWFFPIPRPKGDEAKQIEESEELLTAAVAARRESSLYPRPEPMNALFLPLVRLLHRRAQMRPAMSRAKVFIVAEAERLVPQASSQEAANAMLKVLEEPPQDTYFILTTAEPAALLPTIKSRMVQMRVGRLTPPVIASFLTDVADIPKAEAARRAEIAAGSIGAALEMGGGNEGERDAAATLLAAARKGPVARHALSFATRPMGGRGEFTALLDAAAEQLRDELARRLHGAGSGAGGDAPATRLAAQLREIEAARKLAQGNVNPQLIVSDLLRKLAEAGT
jgi:DNA polymerase III subunit delta'